MIPNNKSVYGLLEESAAGIVVTCHACDWGTTYSLGEIERSWFALAEHHMTVHNSKNAWTSIERRLKRDQNRVRLAQEKAGDRVDIPDWDGAACVGMDPEIFFPDKLPERGELNAIRKICASCPIQAKCLEWALHNEGWGIWGGLTADERNTLRRRLNLSYLVEGRNREVSDDDLQDALSQLRG